MPSKLQEAVNAFAARWQAERGEKPSQDTLLDGTFSRQTGRAFCLCFNNFVGLGAMIDFTGMTCTRCEKPVTEETQAWGEEARRERAKEKRDGERDERRAAQGSTDASRDAREAWNDPHST